MGILPIPRTHKSIFLKVKLLTYRESKPIKINLKPKSTKIDNNANG